MANNKQFVLVIILTVFAVLKVNAQQISDIKLSNLEVECARYLDDPDDPDLAEFLIASFLISDPDLLSQITANIYILEEENKKLILSKKMPLEKRKSLWVLLCDDIPYDINSGRVMVNLSFSEPKSGGGFIVEIQGVDYNGLHTSLITAQATLE